jgi:lysophospholipase L1-like esterase
MKFSVKKYYMVLFLLPLLMFGTIGCFVDTGLVQNNKVVMIGDSIFHLSNEIAKNLETYSGEAYRQYYMSGAQMIGGTMTPVIKQYANAKADDPIIRTVIMDGGGNDILINNQEVCSGDTVSQECKDLIEPVFEAARTLFREMYNDGVQHMIYLGYYVVDPDGYMIGEAGLKGVTDYSAAKSKATCDELNVEFGKTIGYYIDTRDAFIGHEKDYIISDGVHPSAAGSKVLADLIWNLMVAKNIEQN